MLRVRRYRFFLVATALILGTIFYLGSGLASGESLLGPSSPPSLKDFRFDDAEETNPTTPLKPVIDDAFWVREKSKAAQEEEARLEEQEKHAQAAFPQVELPGLGIANKLHVTQSTTTSEIDEVPATALLAALKTSHANADPSNTDVPGKGGLGSTSTATASIASRTHWIKQKESFPVPTESIIQLPTGTPKKIPRIQYDFSAEPETDKAASVRQERLDAIRASFTRSWTGYKDFAWGHDELKPESGGSKDPFCGWAATLVDALDTLWIMGMKEEFEEAVEAAALIDFTTSTRPKLPLFETTIRYLGGLLGAYDISGGKYPVLLKKATELAEILMGSFDTPNRMPVTYYPWAPTFASRPARAATRVVLAELGSLSVEFTRLAQLTEEMKYYDAVARITDAFELWQNNTRLPGLWPLSVDASGCEMPGRKYNDYQKQPALAPTNLPVVLANVDAVTDEHPLNEILPPSKDSSSFGSDSADVNNEKKNPADMYAEKDKSTWADDVGKEGPSRDPPIRKRQMPPNPLDLCKPVGLGSPNIAEDRFSIGGEADSTYEYIAKEWLLLGGLNDQYQNMYESFAEAFTSHLLYRPMIQEDVEILFSGTVYTSGLVMPDGALAGRLDPSMGHLACFIGGSIGMGSKIFERKSDLTMAIKLTEGCVWAYNTTVTGIMPEDMTTTMCESMDDCPWNETQWYSSLDPNPERRLGSQYKSPSNLEPGAHQPPLSGLAGQSSDAKKTLEDNIKDASGTTKEQAYSYVDAASSKVTEGVEDAAEAVKIGASDAGKALGDKAKEGASDAAEAVKNGLYSSANAVGSKVKEATSDAADAMKEGVYNAGQASADAVKEAAVKAAQAAQDGLAGTRADLQDSSEALNSEETAELAKSLSRREVGDFKELGVDTAEAIQLGSPTTGHLDLPSTDSPATKTNSRPPGVPKQPLNHEDYVEQMIQLNHLWPGVLNVPHKAYILRPEAIESVFYMYRITGDETWREKGWNMWLSIDKATKAKYGNSAIRDVTSSNVVLLDQAESFWLAETLKYFYLLFSDSDVVSLDDYVLNTEAHPFLRPDATVGKS